MTIDDLLECTPVLLDRIALVNRFGDLRLDVLRRENRLMSETEAAKYVFTEGYWPEVIEDRN